MNSHTEPQSNPTVAHERTDANSLAVTKFGIALALTVVLVQLILWWTFDHLSSTETRLNPPVPAVIKQQAPTQPPEPRLQGNPRIDLKKMRDGEDAVLNHYGWVDQQRGIVHIPISRALDVVAARGLPRFAAQPGVRATAGKNPGDTGPGRAFGANPTTPR